MSAVEGIAASLRDALVRTGGSLVVHDADFSSTLRLGEVIRGRVLRHYDGNRYLVQFGEHQKVVDSSIPLQVSEVFGARVKALGDRVELQHLRDEGRAAATAVEAGRTAGSPSTDELSTVLARWNVALSAEEIALISSVARRSGDPALVQLASVVASKLDIPLSREVLRAVVTRLAAALPGEHQRATHALVAEAAKSTTAAETESALEPIVALLASLSESDAPDDAAVALEDAAEHGLHEAPAGGDDREGRRGDEQQRWDLGHWLFNVQSHPRIAHRLLTLPLWVGDRLTELNVALFEQSGERDAADGTRLLRVVLELDLERLGHVQIRLTGAGRHLRMRIASDREAGAEALARFAPGLRGELEDRGWQLDEMEHVLARGTDGDAALQAVLLHHITQDSLSRWM